MSRGSESKTRIQRPVAVNFPQLSCAIERTGLTTFCLSFSSFSILASGKRVCLVFSCVLISRGIYLWLLSVPLCMCDLNAWLKMFYVLSCARAQSESTKLTTVESRRSQAARKLTEQVLINIYGTNREPAVCSSWTPTRWIAICGEHLKRSCWQSLSMFYDCSFNLQPCVHVDYR